MSRRLLAMGLLVMIAAVGQSAHAAGKGQTKFKRVSPQYIAALGDPRCDLRERRAIVGSVASRSGPSGREAGPL